jgi:hypothetical protein
MMFIPDFSESRKIGTFILFLGIFFLLLGMLLLFDRKLLAMGNLLFLVGFSIMSGPLPTLKFFGLAGDSWKERWQKRWRGLITFMGGILLVLFGYTWSGMFCEMFGFLNLFGALFPTALALLRRLPIIGPCLNLPILATIADKIAGKETASMV